MKFRFRNDCTDESCNLQGISVPGQELFGCFGNAKNVKLVLVVDLHGLELHGNCEINLTKEEANSLAYRILRMTGELTSEEIYRGK